MWFESWESILEIVITGLVSFICLIILLRISGKRTLTKLNAFDLIITLAIGSTLASTITSDTMTVADGVAALATLILAQYSVAWLEVRYPWFQKAVKSQPSVLVYEGKFHEQTMRRERISKVEVMAAMRYSGLSDPSQARVVLLETDGQISVIPYSDKYHKLGVLQTVESFSPQNKESQK